MKNVRAIHDITAISTAVGPGHVRNSGGTSVISIPYNYTCPKLRSYETQVSRLVISFIKEL
jgi:hypothetical protein